MQNACVVLHSGETDLELIYQTINTEGSQTRTRRVFLVAPESAFHTGAQEADVQTNHCVIMGRIWKLNLQSKGRLLD